MNFATIAMLIVVVLFAATIIYGTKQIVELDN